MESVSFDVPPGACDAHVHIVGEPARFPMSSERDYTPPPARADALREILQRLELDRVVIITPTIYGANNSATLSAIEQLGRSRARGVALVEAETPPGTLDALKDGGIAGVRVFLSAGDPFDATAAAKRLQSKFDLAEGRGWHLDISAPPDAVAALRTQLSASPVPVVLSYFAWLAGGIGQPGFDAILSLVESGRAYVKFSEPYRLSKIAPDYPDLVPIVQALVAANPDRILWGSGWPHVDSSSVPGRKPTDPAPNLPVDTGHLLNLLAAWVPDAATRHKILVENPVRLYEF